MTFWNVNDLKIFHVSPKGVDGVLSQLNIKYGKVSPLSLNQGRVHDYLDTRLDYSKKFKVHITMPNHIKVILEAAEEDMNGIAETPASNDLFQVREDGSTLAPVQADLF